MLKRLTSLILVLTMVLTMLPVSVRAEETETSQAAEPEAAEQTIVTEEPTDLPEESIFPAETEETAAPTQEPISNAPGNSVIRTGDCGDSATWSFDSDGTLTISGTGAISDYGYEETPWYGLYFELKKIVVEEGITSIGQYAFSGIYTSDITLPETLISISDYAFYKANMTELVLPEGLQSIGSNAFAYCDDLESISFPSTLTTIGSFAFNRCTALEAATLPDSLTSVGTALFYECDSLKSIAINEGISEVPQQLCYSCDCLETVTIAEGVTSIGSSAFFGCTSLTNLQLASTVQYIWFNAFAGCTALETLALPTDLVGIESDAFKNCSALSNLVLPAGVEYVEYDAFSNCTSLEYVSIPASLNALSSGYTSSPQDVFSNCTNLTYIDVAEDNQNYCDVDGILFSKDMTTLHLYPAGKPEYSYVVPEGVTNLHGAFEDCRYLTELTLPQSMTVVSGLGNSASLTIIHIPYGAQTVANDAFVNCTALKQVDLPMSIEAIIPGCFAGCTSLESIAWPVDFVGTSTFEGCTSLREITFLNPKMQGFGPYAFRDCISLEEITLPAGFYTYDPSCFQGCISLKNIYVDPGNPFFYSVNGVLFGSTYGTLERYPCGKTIVNYTAPDGTASVSHNAFEASQCERIILPDGLTEIDWRAFRDSKKLASVVLPDTLTYIGYEAFGGCTELTDVYFRGTEEQWAQITIDDENGILNDVTMHYSGVMDSGSSGKNIEWDFFEGVLTISGYGEMRDFQAPEDTPWYSIQDAVTKVAIKGNVTYVGENTFRAFSNLEEVSFSDYVETVGEFAFANCPKLTRITLYDSMKTILGYAFWECPALKEVIFNGSWQERNNINIVSSGNEYLIYIPFTIMEISDYVNNHSIEINHAGSAYAYYIGQPNQVYTYQIDDAVTPVESNDRGYFSIFLGTFDTPGVYKKTIWFVQIGDERMEPAQKFTAEITVTDLTFVQNWQASLKASVGVALKPGFPGPMGAKLSLGKAGLSAGVGTALNITRTVAHGKKTLELISDKKIEAGASIKSGITAKSLDQDFTVFGLHGGISGNVTGTYGIRFNDYEELNNNQRKAIGTFFLGEILLANPNAIFYEAFYKDLSEWVYDGAQCDVIEGSGMGYSLEGGFYSGAMEVNGEEIFTAANDTIEKTVAMTTTTSGSEKTKGYSLQRKNNLSLLMADSPILKNGTLGIDFLGKDISVTAKTNPSEVYSETIETTSLADSLYDWNLMFVAESITAKYDRYIFQGDALDELLDNTTNFVQYLRGFRKILSDKDLTELAGVLSTSRDPIPYSSLLKDQVVYTIPFEFGFGAVAKGEVGFEVSYLEALEYETESGFAVEDGILLTGKSDDLSSLVDANRITLEELICDEMMSLEFDAQEFFRQVTCSVYEGYKDLIANITGKPNAKNNWTVTIVNPGKTASQNNQSYAYSHQVDILSQSQNTTMLSGGIQSRTTSNSVFDKAATLGYPFSITVTDNDTGESVTDLSGEPLEFTIHYTTEDLEAAGLSVYSPVVRNGGIAMYRYSDDGDYFEFVGKINDPDAMAVTATITKTGHYVLAVDACAPQLGSLELSDFGTNPTITAHVDDLTGLDQSCFVFALDGVEKVNSSNIAEHYQPKTGIFTYTVPEGEALSEGKHTMTFALADTTGNTETYSYSFNVDLTAPTISDVSIAGHTNAGSTLEIRTQVHDENLTQVYAVFSKLMSDGTWSEEATAEMVHLGENLWGLSYEGDGSIVTVSVRAVDIGENIANSTPVSAVPFVESITLAQEYITLYPNQTAALTVNVMPTALASTVEWSVDDSTILTVDENGTVSAGATGTAYVTVSITSGGSTLTDRCRVDVADPVELKGVQLNTNKLTTELYSTDYAAAELLLMLPQNMILTTTGESSRLSADSSVAIDEARFTDPAIAELFGVTALDDRNIVIVPTNYAVDNPELVAKKYTDSITVTVQGVEYETEELTLNVKQTKPNLKATVSQFNSFYSHQTQELSITGGTVTNISLDSDKAQPDWLRLYNGRLSLTEKAPNRSASAKLHLLVETEEWRIPAAVTLTVKNARKAPGLKLSASSVKMTADTANSSGIALKLLPKNKKDSLTSLNVSGITSQTEGYSVANFDAATGAFTLKANSGFVPGKVTLNVSFTNTDEVLSLTVKVAVQTVSLKLSAKTVTLNTSVTDNAQVKLMAAPADYIITAPDITGDEAGIFDLTYEDGVLTIWPTDAAEAGKTYTLNVSAGGSKPAKLTVKTVDAAPTVTLKAKGNVDLSFPDKAATVTAAFKNYASGAIEDYTAVITAPDGTVSDDFTVTRNGTVFMICCNNTEIATGAYKLTLKLTLPEGTEVENTVKLTVKRTAVKLKLSPAKLTLNSTIADKASVAVTCTTKGYDFSEPIWELKAKNGKDSAEGKLDISWNSGKLEIAVNDNTEPGATYKLLVKANAYAPAATLTITIPTEAKSVIKSSLKAKGAIDVIREGTSVVLTPSYKNAAAAGEETLNIYSSADNYAEPVNDLFNIEKDSQGRYILTAAKGLDHSKTYKAQLVTMFGSTEVRSALTKFTVKMGSAKLTLKADGSILFGNDCHSRIGFTFSAKDATLNEVQEVTIKADKKGYDQMLEVIDLGNGEFAIGFKDETVNRSLLGKTITVTLNIKLQGNETEKVNTTAKLKLTVLN